MDAALSSAVRYRPPIWPLVIAPLVAGIYYLAIKEAFMQSIPWGLAAAAPDVDIGAQQWDPYWPYRGAADVISTGIATFVAAGLAPGRERAAGFAGGCMISLAFLVHGSVPEAWHQIAIEILRILAPPIVGAYIAGAAENMHRLEPTGFGGINRWHFLWLWLAAYCYAIGLIAPAARIYVVDPDNGMNAPCTVLAICVIRAAAMAVPGYYGIALLAGQTGGALNPAVRNLLGVIILVAGLMVGLVVHPG